jgi:DNA invertase Pin-like site-specific DNA recombinase
VATAYSYIRFSSPKQAAGDSLRRQTEATAAWCAREGVTLDNEVSLRDLGKSAFRRKDFPCYALAEFLQRAEQGRIAKGSYLVLENLDRLSREDERTALELWMRILGLGINIVQLFPETVFRHDKTDMLDVMRAIIELSRGHRESALKSERLAQCWERKRREAAERSFHAVPPAWLCRKGGRLVVVKRKARVVRRIFELAASGYGQGAIVKKLRADKVPLLADPVHAYVTDGAGQRVRLDDLIRGAQWTKTYVGQLLRNRAVLGECQPRKAGKPAGDPVPNYFPPVVSESLFHAAQEAVRGRRGREGRPGQARVQLFSGLLYDAFSGQPLHVGHGGPGGGRDRRGRRRAYLVPYEAAYRSFPLELFETALLTSLAEVNPADVVGREDAGAVAALAGRVAAVEKSIADLEADLDEHGESPTLLKRVRRREAELRALTAQLREAERQAACPLAESWGDFQRLLQFTEKDEDRRQLRAALLRVVERVNCAFSGFRGSLKMALVSATFRGAALAGHCRTWQLWYTRGTRAKEAQVEVFSFGGAIGPGIDPDRLDGALQTALAVAAAARP